MTATQMIDPMRATSALGITIARLLQAAGLEVSISDFGEIDEIAQSLTDLESELKALNDSLAQVEERIDEVEANDDD